jgi:tetratricopeptide (TPR) repeat protein
MGGDNAKLLQTARGLCQTGDLRGAANICRDILKEDPDNWEFLHLLALTLNEAGLADQALPLLQRCLAIRGADSSLLFNYGVVLRKLNRFREAARTFRHAADAAPERFDCWFNLGEVLRRLGNLDEAVAALLNAANIEPGNPDAWYILGNVRLEQGQFEAAIDFLGRAIELAPKHGDALNNLGLALKNAGRLDESAEVFQRSVLADPDAPASHDNLGNVRASMGDVAGAIESFREALRLKPDYADARFNLAEAIFDQRDFGAAETEFRLVLKTDSEHRPAWMKAALCRQLKGDPDTAKSDLEHILEHWPDDTAVLAQMGNVMRDMGDFENSRDCFERALLSSPDNPVILGNLALACQHEGKLAEAIDHYRHALKFDIHNEQLHSNLAQLLLLGENYPEGWAEFEHRLSNPVIAGIMKDQPGVPWSGEPLDGKIILLQAEQGFGDLIQFSRYPAEVARRGARVLLAGPGRLASLLSNIEGLAGYVDAAEPLPDADFHVPLMSLPHHLKSGVIGADEPYLCADPQRIAYWRDRFDALKGLKIGLAWQGNVEYEMDYARSIPALLLAQLLEPVDAHLVVLQQGYGREQIDQIAANFPIVDIGEDLDKDAAFVDTAAIMANLDLIITSDTSIPHLAGATGRPVWVLLPFAPDWRWLLDRADSPWYRSMRLFRQSKPRDWPSALDQVRKCLARWREMGGDPNSAVDFELGLEKIASTRDL